MTILQPSQIKQYASNAGFRGELVNIMTAIALAESGGRTDATNPRDNGGRQTSWGLWQISYGNHTPPLNWSDPQANANLAYQKYLSQGLAAWGTYTSGKYKDFMNASTASTGTKPWWTFPRIDNFGKKDPQGNFWKPDSNIMIPWGYPIQALLSGTVTDISPNTSWGGQNVVTIKLDQPLNALATHTVYQHMSGFAPGLSVGQHVNTGDLVGYNNLQGQGADFGFGLFSGDKYPTGTAWSQLQQDLSPGGAQMLNPVSILNSFASGGSVSGLLSYNQNALNTSTGCQWYDLPCWFQNQVESLLISSSFVIFGLILLLLGIFILFVGHGGSVEVAGTGVGLGQGGAAPG